MKKILGGLLVVGLMLSAVSYAQSKRVVVSGIGSYDDPSKEENSVVYSLDQSLRADQNLMYGTAVYLHSVFDNANSDKGDGSRAIELTLEWRTFNHTNALREILPMVSDNIAKIIAKNEDVSKTTIYWIVSFLEKDKKSARFDYVFDNKQIKEKTKKYAPVLLKNEND